MNTTHKAKLFAAGLFGLSLNASAQDNDLAKQLAKQLANPINSLISVPVQSNLDFGIGPGDGTKWTTNIQPVFPFSLNENWNLISRTIPPYAIGSLAMFWAIQRSAQFLP